MYITVVRVIAIYCYIAVFHINIPCSIGSPHKLLIFILDISIFTDKGCLRISICYASSSITNNSSYAKHLCRCGYVQPSCNCTSINHTTIKTSRNSSNKCRVICCERCPHINQLKILLHGPLCLRHMTRIPLKFHMNNPTFL